MANKQKDIALFEGQKASSDDGYLMTQIVHEEQVGHNLNLTVSITGSVRTHAVGVDPDDGSLDYNYEDVDQTEVVTLNVFDSYYRIKQAIRDLTHKITMDVMHGLLDAQDVARTNDSLNYQLDHGC